MSQPKVWLVTGASRGIGAEIVKAALAAGEYVVATGITHSVRELVECAFGRVGLDWQEFVHIDESLVRGTAELHNLVGDPAKARTKLGWSPTVTFEELVHLLVDAELERLRGETGSAARAPA